MEQDSPSFLGRYQLVKVLGTGAMGVVYEAFDPLLGRAVAVKTVLKSQLVDDESRDEFAFRFQREAQAAARLSHAHIVAVFDFGEQDDLAYIVMEFVRGRELAQAFAEGRRFTIGESVRIVCELLEALDFAHVHGIVHRDIKPANVLLDAGERVKLADFGIARMSTASQAERTVAGAVLGTPSYMSPEQVLGLQVGPPTDLFAAGLILYQLLTGERAFSGSGSFGVQSSIVHDEPTRPSLLSPGLPQAFDDILATALTKQPDKRFASAADFADALESALARHPGIQDTTPARPRQPAATGEGEATVLRPPGANVDLPLTNRMPTRRTRWGVLPVFGAGTSLRDEPVEIPALPARVWGRDAALAELKQMLQGHRLVTVLGAGGVGKTTLAITIAHQARQHGLVDVRWAALSPTSDPAMVPSAVARALRLDLDDASDSIGLIARALRSRRALLVIDDAEHVAGAVAELVTEILSRAPQVQVLVTSQVALDIDGERLYRLHELEVPPSGCAPNVALASGAVAMFVDQAQALQHGFELEPGNVDSVISVCRQLDGIPLAIRLATARLPALGLEGLLANLDARFQLLAAENRNLPARQRTLRAAFDWTHGFLSAQEQALFRCLGIFAGGFTLDLMQAVAAIEGANRWGLINTVGHLVDRSLVGVSDGEPQRYHMTISGRQYALDRLRDAGEATATALRHATAVFELFNRWNEPYWLVGDRQWLGHCHAEIDNLRAALDWSTRHDIPLAIKLIGCCTRACMTVRGLAHEIRLLSSRIEPLMPQDTPIHARAEFCRVRAAVTKSTSPEISRGYAAQAIELFRQIGHTRRLFDVIFGTIVMTDTPVAQKQLLLAEMEALPVDWPGRRHPAIVIAQAKLATEEGRFTHALPLLESAIMLHDAERFGRMRANLLLWLAEVECNREHAEVAIGHVDEALGLLRSMDHSQLLPALALRARIELQLGHAEQARTLLAQFMPLSRACGWELLARNALLFAWLALLEQRPRTAARLLGFHGSLRRPGTGGSALGANLHRQVSELLDDGHFQHLLTEGSLLDEMAVAQATLARDQT